MNRQHILQSLVFSIKCQINTFFKLIFLLLFQKMNMFCCSDTRMKRPSYPLTIYNEFTFIDPTTKQIQRQIIPFEEGKKYQKFKNWKRVKFLSRNYTQLFKGLKQSQTNFVDLEFPHTNAAITTDDTQEKMLWMRVRDLVDDAVYSKQMNIKSLQKFKSNNKQLQNALILIARAHPNKFKQLLSKTVNDEGIYEFRLYKDGIIQNVVIDDFVPVFKKAPIFAGPVRQRQVYPMLLQKAIAKLYGCYESIPVQCQALMQTIFCGAVRRKDFNSLDNKELISLIVDQGLKKKGLTILISKDDSKVRNYGINQNQLYQIINKYQIEINERMVKLYEFLTQTKINAWNGKFSLNDQIWRDIDPQTKTFVFNQMKKNHSFCICQQDLSRIFKQLLVFQDTSTSNKDWIQNLSQCDYPSFTKFTLEQDDRIFVRLVGPHKLRQSLILARLHQNNQLQYIGGSIQTNQKSVELSKQLQAGDYLVCALQEWVLSKSGQYRVFLSSNTHTILSKAGSHNYPNFFQNMFFNHSVYSQQEKDKKSKTKIYSYCLLVYEIGLAYLHIRSQNSSKKNLKVLIDRKALKQQNWQIFQPYKDVKQIMISKVQKTNNDKIIVLKNEHFRMDKKVIFPSMAFKIQE